MQNIKLEGSDDCELHSSAMWSQIHLNRKKKQGEVKSHRHCMVAPGGGLTCSSVGATMHVQEEIHVRTNSLPNVGQVDKKKCSLPNISPYMWLDGILLKL